jgi:excisionase family DNA binding protein
MPTKSSNTQIPKYFCTTRQAADLLGMSVGTVQLWVDSGVLQAWKTPGGHRRVMRDSVQALLAKTPPAAPVESIALQMAHNLRVLVVEDDAHLLRLYQAQLSAWPMKPEVKVVDSAIAALLEMGRRRPDLLVTDLHMSGMDGFNLLRVLRSTPEMTATTIAVVTGLDASDIARRGGVPAGIAVLPKPIPFQRLLDIAKGIKIPSRQHETFE